VVALRGKAPPPHARQLLVLAHGGVSNGPRCRAWICGLQSRVCDPHGLRVTVCHYPTGASKWNPIEHRLFSEITKNWAGRPLDSYETILKYAQSTRTKTGLRVRAHLVRRGYPTGVKISKERMVDVRVRRHEIQPDRNYTVSPR